MDLEKLQERFCQQAYPGLERFARWYYADESDQADFLGWGWAHFQRSKGTLRLQKLILMCRSCVYHQQPLPGTSGRIAYTVERRRQRVALRGYSSQRRGDKDNPAHIAAERELFALVRECCTPTEQRVFDALCLDPRTGSGRLQRELGIGIERVEAARACIHHYYLSLSKEPPPADSEGNEQQS